MQNSIEKKITQKIDEIRQARESLNQSISFKMQSFFKAAELLRERFPYVIDNKINIAQNQVDSLQKMLESNHPKLRAKKGFVQISKDSKVIDISSLNIDEVFELMSDEVVLSAKVLSKKNI
jgi:exodeoxyribonuclease VII large subunit